MSKKEKDIESRIEGKPASLKGRLDEARKIWSKLSLKDRIRISGLLTGASKKGLESENNAPDKDDFIVRQ